MRSNGASVFICPDCGLFYFTSAPDTQISSFCCCWRSTCVMETFQHLRDKLQMNTPKCKLIAQLFFWVFFFLLLLLNSQEAQEKPHAHTRSQRLTGAEQRVATTCGKTASRGGGKRRRRGGGGGGGRGKGGDGGRGKCGGEGGVGDGGRAGVEWGG